MFRPHPNLWGLDIAFAPPHTRQLMDNFPGLKRHLTGAMHMRRELFHALHAERTDCYRLFHGVAEGLPGLAIDRFGPVVLIQTFRQPLTHRDLDTVGGIVQESFATPLQLIWNHRGDHCRESFEQHHDVVLEEAPIGHEMGVAYDVRPRHRGIDPLLFPDLRAGRRRCRARAEGRTVLNLFAYTCGIGLAAMAGGATEVWNVDFAESALETGRENAARNGFATPAFVTIREDVLPTIRQLAGMPLQGRGRRRPRRHRRFSARQFDLVVLDPPRWATSPFGAVDVVNDYQSLFKPALLATRKGGAMLVTNNVGSVRREEWVDALRRCAAKAGRAITEIEIITPEADFPSTDGRPPLKMAWIAV